MRTTLFPLIMSVTFFLSCEKSSDVKRPLEPIQLELSEKAASIIESDNAFGLNIFRKVVERDNSSANIFISPTSIALALAMTYNGSVADTKTAFENTLMKQGFTAEEINESYKSLMEALKSVDSKVILNIANSIWYKENYNVLPGFIDLNQQYYDAEVSSLDFLDPSAVNTINSWVDEKTNGRIQEILDQIPAEAVMYLINAIYFKGAWKFEFEKLKTVEGPFYTDGEQAITVDLMKQTTTVPAMNAEFFQMADLPYGQGNFSMTILLPRQGYGTEDILGLMTRENWDNWIEQLQEHNVDLTIPKFTFEYQNLLNDELTDMGLGIAFSEGADFSGINGVGGLLISRVIHKSFVEVNEEGTEAAAVTAVEIVETSMPAEPQFLTFKVDKPFIFAIRETTTGAILFLGMVQNPSVEENGSLK